MTPDDLRAVLPCCWSVETSRHWRADNPACGQCNVTALVVQDLFGGEVLKTWLPEGWHHYNRLNDERCDLTASQFTQPPDYQDLPTDRAETLAGTTEAQYRHLAERVRAAFATRRG